MLPPRLPLAHLPTPLWRHDALDALVGTRVWVKRDDMTAGAAAGNKIRKLELLLHDARARGATTLLTCGGAQSNHARATALLGAELGFRVMLFLRTPDPMAPPPTVGNILLDRLAGATLRWITPEQYRQREPLLAAAAAELTATGEVPYVIPEGGSNGLGALGYTYAMREVRAQLDLGLGGGPAPYDAVVFACGSGGTAAGIALGARHWQVAEQVVAMAVCEDSPTFAAIIARVVAEARVLCPGIEDQAPVRVCDEYRGPGYAQTTPEQRAFLLEVARRSGLVLDPVYSGKALYGLASMPDRPARVLFVHTGGLPGLLAQADELAEQLA